MAVAWNRVRAALVTRLGAVLPYGVVLYDGPAPRGDNPAVYLTVGFAPSAAGDATGTFAQDFGPDGYVATETGGVLMEAAAVTGDATIPSVFDVFDAVATSIQSDMTLGGLLVPGSLVTTSATVVEAQTNAGATQRLVITVQYQTNI